MEQATETRTDKDGQIEMAIAETPLFEACDRLVNAKARTIAAKKDLEDAEKAWCDQMKAENKKKINFKGDIIQYIHGRTTDDHARFTKP